MDPGTTTAAPAGLARLLRGLLKSMRPKQWTKNIFVFAALIFDLKLFQTGVALKSLAGFVILCLLSSAVYLLNDSADVAADRLHPRKSRRPIARGDVPVPVALAVAAILALGAIGAALALDPWFGLIAGVYITQNLLYTLKLKHIVILDVIVLALGYVLRVAAGAALVRADNFSPWLYLCASLLALLLGFGKRRGELVTLGDKAGTRRILSEYSIPLLDQIISIVTAALLVCYMLYTFNGTKLPHNNTFMLTIPPVVYFVFRYLYLVHVRGEGGAPDELLLRDRPLQIAMLLWGVTVVAVLYAARAGIG